VALTPHTALIQKEVSGFTKTSAQSWSKSKKKRSAFLNIIKTQFQDILTSMQNFWRLPEISKGVSTPLYIHH